jgi:hypothetical protein
MRKQTPTKLYVVDSDGKRHIVSGASGFVVRRGSVELEVSIADVVNGSDHYVARVSTKDGFLVYGPGDGNSGSLRVRPRGRNAS